MSEKNPDDQGRDADNQPSSDGPLAPKHEGALGYPEKRYGPDQGERFTKATEQTADAMDAVAQATITSARANVAMVCVTIGMLIVTAVQCTYTHYSLKQSDAALKASIEASRTDQRAWVSCHFVLEAPSDGQPFSTGIKLVNTGKTFALNIETFKGVIITTDMSITDEAVVKIYEADKYKDKSSKLGALFPQDDVTLPYKSRPLTGEEVQGIKDGKIKVFLVGEVFYDDIFRVKRHFTNFFAEFDPSINLYRARAAHNDAE